MSASVQFLRHTDQSFSPMENWPAAVVPGEAIEEEVAHLADTELSDLGRRLTHLMHPNATAPGLGFAPGIDVSINVLRPGEATRPFLTNANFIGFCIRGEGQVVCGLKSLAVEKWTTWNLSAMRAFTIRNTGKSLLVYLTYSNIPLLEKLRAHYFDDDAVMPSIGDNAARSGPPPVRARDLSLNAPIGEDGGRILGYEYTVDIDEAPLEPLAWPFHRVAEELGMITNFPTTYRGRQVGTLYNPGTGRRNGTTNAFFAAIGQTPPNVAAHLHRHSSCAINYYFSGSGNSIVEDQRMEWKAGDLQFSAPSWAAHRHATGPDGALSLTVQDHPFHIGNDSLVWQEELDGPVLRLGGQAGPETNLAEILQSA